MNFKTQKRIIKVSSILLAFICFTMLFQTLVKAGYDLDSRQLWPLLPSSEAEVLVLEYHSITDIPEGAKYPDLYVPKDAFNKQLQALYDAGLVGISFIDAVSQMKAGNYNMGNVVITFDDGYSDNYWASQKLNFMKFGGTFYIPTEFPNKSFKEKNIFYLTWDEIRNIFGMGFEIGSHTVNHVDLALCNESKVKYEIEQSKRDIQVQLEKVEDSRPKIPLTFSIPMGSYTSAIIEEIEKYGFEGCVTSNPGLMTIETIQKAPRIKMLKDSNMSNILSYYLRRNLKKEGEIKKGSKSQRIKCFRTMLTRLGYPLTDSDYFDEKMEKSVSEYQKQFSLKECGILNTSTIDRIVSDFIDLVLEK